MKYDFIFDDRSFPDRAERIRAAGADRGEWYYYRRTVTFGTLPEKAELFTLGAGYFSVYINGAFLCEYIIRSYIYDRAYEVFDITRYIKTGENEIRVYSCESGGDNGGFYCEIASSIKYSCTDWEYKRDDAMRSKATFFLENDEPEIYDSRIATGSENGLWKKADCIRDMPYEHIYQSKQEPQTNVKIKFEKAIAVLGIKEDKKYDFALSYPAGKYALLYCGVSSDKEFTAELFASEGVYKAFFDGAEISSDGSFSADKGTHLITVVSLGVGKTAFSVKTESDLAFSEWKEYLFEKPKQPARYPWNEKKTEPIIPREMMTAAKSASINDVPKEISENAKRAAICEIPLWHYIFTQKYFVPADGFCLDENLCDVLDKESGKSLTVKSGESGISVPKGNGKAAIIFDMGKETAGNIEFYVTAGKNAEITLFTFEMITKSGIRLLSRKNAGKYICSEGHNSYVSRGRRGFRYICLCVDSDVSAVDINYVGAVEKRFPAEPVGKFSSSDERLNGIYDMAIDTAKVCMLDSYVDCPGFEQNIWVGDAGITAEVNMMNFGARRFDRRYLYTIGRSMDEAMGRTYRRGNPRYEEPTYLPCSCFTTYPEGGIPIWSFTWAMQVIGHYMYFGEDEGFAQSVCDLAECLERCKKHINERGLFEIDGAWNLIEWADNDLTVVGEVSANNMMLAGLFERAAEFFDMTGDLVKADDCRKTYRSLKDAINEYCWSDEKRGYVDTVRDDVAYERYVGFYKSKNKTPYSFDEYRALERISVQTATFALLYDIAEGKRAEICKKTVTDGVASGKYTAGTPANVMPDKTAGTVGVGSPFFLYYLLKTLYKTGEAELAASVIKRDWGNMLDDGLKTCVEKFKDENGEWGRSAAHAWSASPAVFCMTEILGVKPIKPAYEEFAVTPHPCGLKYAKGAVPTPYGNVEVEWREINGEIKINVKAPKECRMI